MSSIQAKVISLEGIRVARQQESVVAFSPIFEPRVRVRHEAAAIRDLPFQLLESSEDCGPNGLFRSHRALFVSPTTHSFDIGGTLSTNEGERAMLSKRKAGVTFVATFVLCGPLSSLRPALADDAPQQIGCSAGICSYLFVNSISLYGGDAAGLAIDPKGNLYVAENVNGLGLTPQGPFVVKVNPKGVQTVIVPQGVLGDVSALALDRWGNLYIADGNGFGAGQPAPKNVVWKLAPHGTMTAFVSVTDPSGLAFDQKGNLYVSSWSDGAVYKFSPRGRLLGIPLSGLGANSLPYGVAIDSVGNLYVAGFGSHYNSAGQIFKVTPSGSVSVFVSPPLTNGAPASLVFDSAGSLYAGYYNSLEILKIAPDGSYVTYLGGGIAPDAPNGLAIGPTGALFVSVNGMRTTTLPAVVKLTGIVSR